MIRPQTAETPGFAATTRNDVETAVLVDLTLDHLGEAEQVVHVRTQRTRISESGYKGTEFVRAARQRHDVRTRG